ncbi:uncharacterized protein LOC126096493 [Schistocerca cancellata]|uniref:uncharacterized protein LOC126096493 n=1 Tax=Schistocerca cancellata TaxID=274614 RepID=UPI002117B185|nr:uncharacterized protein LOC126096493 [Schistocerca cancellata]
MTEQVLKIISKPNVRCNVSCSSKTQLSWSYCALREIEEYAAVVPAIHLPAEICCSKIFSGSLPERQQPKEMGDSVLQVSDCQQQSSCSARRDHLYKCRRSSARLPNAVRMRTMCLARTAGRSFDSNSSGCHTHR